jgi:hypothetical protein
MGLSEDVTSREGIIVSMQDVALKQYLFLRNLAHPLTEQLGSAGHELLVDAFRHFGAWRGENISMSLSRFGKDRDALALLQNWDSCDFVLASLAGKAVLEGTASRASVSLIAAPGSDYFGSRGDASLLHRFWTEVMRGIAGGYDAQVELGCSRVVFGSPWTITASYSGPTGGRSQPHVGEFEDIFRDPERALTLVRQSSRNAGALYMFVARDAIRRYDATGEQLIREGVRAIGRERGCALKDKHLREGKPLNLRTLMQDWDGPLVSTWVFREGGYLSEGTWHQDCRYCPYADVWAEFGSEGLALGYLYDVELHTTMYQTYHPGTIVQWEALKTRGDHLCKFRFSIPELVRPEDPKFVGKQLG